MTHVAAIKKPLLVFQGSNDPRVLAADTDRFIDATKAQKSPVTYVVYPDEGHGFSRPPNLVTWAGVTEIFLAQCLGGSYEPIGDDAAGSSWTVPVGAAFVHGLE